MCIQVERTFNIVNIEHLEEIDESRIDTVLEAQIFDGMEILIDEETQNRLDEIDTDVVDILSTQAFPYIPYFFTRIESDFLHELRRRELTNIPSFQN